MNNSKKKLAGAKEKFGTIVEVDKRLNMYTDKVLNPDKLGKINKLITTLDLK